MESASEILAPYKFDVIIDYLVYKLETLVNHLTILKGKMKQYVFISSATVYPKQNNIIDDTCTIGNDGWTYAREKRLCEEYLKRNASQFPFYYTIVRPYITYDDTRIPFPIISKISCWNLIYRLEDRKPIIIPGDGEQIETVTSSIDFANGIYGLLLNSDAVNEDFNLVGDDTTTWNHIIDILESILNVKAEIVYIDVDSLAHKMPSMASELLYDKGYSHIFNNSKIKRVVPDFMTTIRIDEGLNRVVDYYNNHESMRIFDDKWNATEDVLCSIFSSGKYDSNFQSKLKYISSENRYVKKVVNKLHRAKKL